MERGGDKFRRTANQVDRDVTARLHKKGRQMAFSGAAQPRKNRSLLKRPLHRNTANDRERTTTSGIVLKDCVLADRSDRGPLRLLNLSARGLMNARLFSKAIYVAAVLCLCRRCINSLMLCTSIFP